MWKLSDEVTVRPRNSTDWCYFSNIKKKEIPNKVTERYFAVFGMLDTSQIVTPYLNKVITYKIILKSIKLLQDRTP